MLNKYRRAITFSEISQNRPVRIIRNAAFWYFHLHTTASGTVVKKKTYIFRFPTLHLMI